VRHHQVEDHKVRPLGVEAGEGLEAAARALDLEAFGREPLREQLEMPRVVVEPPP
jgi:hypothetical protein